MTDILLIIIIAIILGLTIRELQMSNPTKKDALRRKINLLVIGVMDSELDVETSWILLRLAEKRLDETTAALKTKRKELEDEKAKTPNDWKKVERLNKESIEMGWTNEKNADKSPKYKGEISALENEVEAYASKISAAVMKREFGKMQLIGLEKLKRRGWAKDFNEFVNQKLKDILTITDRRVREKREGMEAE
jgi:hypothetical protein